MESKMNILDGKTIIVTGAASGMGEQHARRCAEWGANVVLTDIQIDKGQAIASEIGKSALFLKHDVSSNDDWNNVVTKTDAHFGPMAGLVNNAAYGGHSLWDDLNEEVFMKFMRINALSVMLGMVAVVPYMKKLGGGSIVNISSTAGSKGAPGALAYTASKFAVTGMTKSAAQDLGEFNIRVNSVHPGFVMTPMLGDALAVMDSGAAARIPLNRMASPDELSPMVALLLSDLSGFVSGGEYFIDGGQSARD